MNANAALAKLAAARKALAAAEKAALRAVSAEARAFADSQGVEFVGAEWGTDDDGFETPASGTVMIYFGTDALTDAAYERFGERAMASVPGAVEMDGDRLEVAI